MYDMCISNSIATLSIYSHNQSSTSYSIHIPHSIAFFVAAIGWHCQPGCVFAIFVAILPRNISALNKAQDCKDLALAIWALRFVLGQTFQGPLGK
jgi:hypothetical protein